MPVTGMLRTRVLLTVSLVPFGSANSSKALSTIVYIPRRDGDCLTPNCTHQRDNQPEPGMGQAADSGNHLVTEQDGGSVCGFGERRSKPVCRASACKKVCALVTFGMHSLGIFAVLIAVTESSFAMGCHGQGPAAEQVDSSAVHERLALGAPCVPSEELQPNFTSFGSTEIVVDDSGSSCSSGICLVNHFQGRVSCPYGQDVGRQECFIPGSNGTKPVTVAVEPQLQDRQAEVAVICSCRCAGPDTGPYCECPAAMDCVDVVPNLGLGSSNLSGSYCIPTGTAYNSAGISRTTCDRSSLSCGDATPYP
jgi:hypothetical protein